MTDFGRVLRFGVCDVHVFTFFPQGGVSPLLYWEETRSSLPQPSNPEPEYVNVIPVPAIPEAAEEIYKPKLCSMEKTTAGYGFHLNGIQGVCGQYIKEVGRTCGIHLKLLFITKISKYLIQICFGGCSIYSCTLCHTDR